MTRLTSITFEVVGTPSPQGSKRGFVIPGKGGKKARAVVVDVNKPGLASWRGDVVEACEKALVVTPARFETAVAAELTFWLARPASVSMSKRPWPSVKPDIDKLERATLDALKVAGLIVDDALVVDLHSKKFYAEGHQRTGAVIHVREI